METNPFILTSRISEQYFCDRVAETENILKCIDNQENIVLTARRRIGKTGLINHCFDVQRIRQNYYEISIDILHTASLKEFVQELGNVSFRAVASRSERMMKSFAAALRSLSASFGYDPVLASPTFDIKLGDIERPQYTLDEIFQFLENADKPCIVAIDEFQQIIRYPEKNVEELLRGKIQKLTNTHFIFAGSERRIMSEMFFSEKRPFYLSATSVALDPIDRDVYREFAELQFRNGGKQLSPDAFLHVYDKFEGVTMHIHRVLHDAYAYTGHGGCISVTDIMSICKSYIHEYGSRLRELMSNVSEQQKEVLYAIVEEKEATSITSSAFIKRHRLKSASSIQSAMKYLLSEDLVTKTGNVYTISDPMLRIWIESEKIC